MYELSTLEAIGATVEDAISRGLEALNTTRDRVTIVVLDPGGKAAPGQRPREARVQLTLNEPEPRPEPEPPAAQPEPAPAAPAVSNEEVMRLAQQTLQELLDRLQVKAQRDGALG